VNLPEVNCGALRLGGFDLAIARSSGNWQSRFMNFSRVRPIYYYPDEVGNG
jgi:hypothetical protein